MTKAQLNQVARKTGITSLEVGEYLEYDFQDQTKPDVSELIDHIVYQQQLTSISRMCDNAHEYAEAWCQMF
jgi:hypothetical protein